MLKIRKAEYFDLLSSTFDRFSWFGLLAELIFFISFYDNYLQSFPKQLEQNFILLLLRLHLMKYSKYIAGNVFSRLPAPLNNLCLEIWSPDMTESNSVALSCPKILRDLTRNQHCRGEGRRRAKICYFVKSFGRDRSFTLLLKKWVAKLQHSHCLHGR